jgi:hypothetical protein
MKLHSAVSRREFVQLAMAGAAVSSVVAGMGASAAFGGKLHSVVKGVHIGMQTFSLRMVRYPDLVAAVQQVGVGEVELFATQIEPTASDAPDIMKWRETISLDFFKDIRKKFNQAGIDIYTYNGRFGAGGGRGRGSSGGGPGGPGGAGGTPTGQGAAPPPATPSATPPPAAPSPGAAPAAAPVTDAQIDRMFEITKALGAKSFSTQMTLDMAKRLVPFAEKHKIIVAVASQDESLLTQLPAISPWLRMDVDIGNFSRAGLDPLQFVKDNYTHLLDIHLKDCVFKGASVPFGTGDSHMKEILQFLRDKKSTARANIDCDYPGTGASVDEVKKCFEYAKSCLA